MKREEINDFAKSLKSAGKDDIELLKKIMARDGRSGEYIEAYLLGFNQGLTCALLTLCSIARIGNINTQENGTTEK